MERIILELRARAREESARLCGRDKQRRGRERGRLGLVRLNERSERKRWKRCEGRYRVGETYLGKIFVLPIADERRVGEGRIRIEEGVHGGSVLKEGDVGASCAHESEGKSFVGDGIGSTGRFERESESEEGRSAKERNSTRGGRLEFEPMERTYWERNCLKGEGDRRISLEREQKAEGARTERTSQMSN